MSKRWGPRAEDSPLRDPRPAVKPSHWRSVCVHHAEALGRLSSLRNSSRPPAHSRRTASYEKRVSERSFVSQVPGFLGRCPRPSRKCVVRVPSVGPSPTQLERAVLSWPRVDRPTRSKEHEWMADGAFQLFCPPPPPWRCAAPPHPGFGDRSRTRPEASSRGHLPHRGWLCAMQFSLAVQHPAAPQGSAHFARGPGELKRDPGSSGRAPLGMCGR